jgi:hypothetical protein
MDYAGLYESAARADVVADGIQACRILIPPR